MNELLSTPVFGLALCCLSYSLGLFISRRTKSPIANPLMIAIITCMAVLYVFKIPMAAFSLGGSMISMFLAPVTASLAMTIYRQLPILKKNLIPVLLGSAAGTLASLGTIYGLCRLFKLDEAVSMALLPKSVTMPIALATAESLGGITPFTVAAVVITGVTGAIFAPLMIKLFRIKNPVAAGTAIGTCSHVLGTARAVEIGETEGAMSGIAVGTSGVFTVLFVILIS